MVELFIALFGLLYILIKISDEKVSVAEFKQAREVYDSWMESVTDKSTAHRLYDILADGGEERKELMREVELALQEMPLNQQAKRYYLDNDDYLRILLARRGKIPALENGAFGVRVRSKSTAFARIEGEFERQKELMLWVEQELQKHGVSAQLVVSFSFSDRAAVLASSFQNQRGYYYYYWNDPTGFHTFKIVKDVMDILEMRPK